MKYEPGVRAAPSTENVCFRCPCAVTDTIGTRINDVGLRGLRKDGVDGFRMTVAGGLGPIGAFDPKDQD